MKACTAFLLFLAARASVESKQLVVPSLHPAKDSHFFKKDYARDVRAPVIHHFDHPFPTVQDNHEYDKDFVKDENRDGGEWTAQWHYDELKNKLLRQTERLKKSKARMDEEKRQWEAALQKEATAEASTRRDEEKYSAAAKAVDEAEDALRDTSTATNGDTQAVEAETSELRACREELRKAKERLQAALANSSKVKEKVEAERDTADEKDEEAFVAQKAEADWEEKLAQAEKEHAAALKVYAAAEARYNKLQISLNEAAEKLKAIRMRHGVGPGIVYKAEKPALRSAAYGFGPPMLLMLVSCVVQA